MSGEGDGPVAQNFSCDLVSFRDATANQSKAMTAWFALVTNGNNGTTACLMPPWKNVLNEQDRWNVTSYVYSLHYTPDQLTQGKPVWDAQCASCHGENGAGDGTMPNLADSATLISRSDTQIFRLLTDGLEDGSHKFDSLSEPDRRAVTAFTRTLGWDNAEVIGVDFTQATPTPNATATPSIPDTDTITVQGKVSNGTAGGAIPSALTVTLRIVESTSAGFNVVLTEEATTDAAGAFSFPSTPRRNGLVYVTSATYAGVLQTGDPVQLQSGSGPTLDLSFPVYEPTDEASSIRIERQRLFVDFISPTVALIQQGIVFSNTGDKVYMGDPATRVVLEVPLPIGATNVTLSQETNDGQFQIGNGVLQSSIPIGPGTSSVQFSYQLNFQGNLTITQPTRYEVADFVAYVPSGGGSFIADAGYVRGEALELTQATYDPYGLRQLIGAGGNINFTVRFGTPESERRGLFTGLLVASAVLIAGMALAIWRLSRK
jgi:mono/diheme cytochrome c family protein